MTRECRVSLSDGSGAQLASVGFPIDLFGPRRGGSGHPGRPIRILVSKSVEMETTAS